MRVRAPDAETRFVVVDSQLANTLDMFSTCSGLFLPHTKVQ